MGNHFKYPKEAGIYKITCSVNGKIYIGKSVNIYYRLGRHKSCAKKLVGKWYFEHALIKYGWESFNVEILEIFENYDKERDKFKLLERESYFIKLFDSTNKTIGYNICEYSNDGSGNSRLPHSEETKEKIRQSLLGRKRDPFSDEVKRKMSQSALGRPKFDETREKLRKANLGKKLSEDHKEKMRQANLGKIVSEETRKTLSEANKGKPSNRKGCKLSEEIKEKIRRGMLGKKHSDESKKRMSIAQKGKACTRVGYRHSEETKEKMRCPSLGVDPTEAQIIAAEKLVGGNEQHRCT
jgi:group I intron endonuclease